MIETFPPAVCGGRQRKNVALAGFTIGAVAAAAALGAVLGLVGSLLAPPVAIGIAIAVAGLGAFRELGLLRIPLPQARRQVPDSWRAELPLPVWSLGYGAGLGAGVFTFQPVATFWAACAGAVALGRPGPAAACLALYGIGRALTVVWPKRDAAQACERLALRRHAVVRANALALVACGALLVAAPATAATVRVPLGSGLDPSTSGDSLARGQIAADGVHVLVEPAEESPVDIPGAAQPGLDGDLLAHRSAEGIQVVNWRTGEVVATVPGPVSKPALDWPLLAFRHDDGVTKRLVLRDLVAGTERVAVSTASSNDIGRPSLAGGRLAWHLVTRRETRIVVLRLDTWRRTVVARSRIAVLQNPSLSGRRVLWIDQRSRSSHVRVRVLGRPGLKTLWSLRGGLFWTTALAGRNAYLTRWRPADRSSYLVRLSF